MKDNNKKKASPWKSLQLGLAVLAGLLVFAYGFQITRVDLEDLRSERRQESLVRVMRALARPEIFEYEQAVEVINAPVHVPCPASGVEPVSEAGSAGPYIVVTPACADPGETVQVEGFNFAPKPPVLCASSPAVIRPTPSRLVVTPWRRMMPGHFIYEMTLPERAQ